VIESTPSGTVKLCAAPVEEKLHVSVLATSEQPGGNAAAAELASVKPPQLNRASVATDRRTPAPRTGDDTQPTDRTAPKSSPRLQCRRPSLADNKCREPNPLAWP
jgi:hypothetical protein